MPAGRKPDLRGLPALRGTDRKDRKRPEAPPLPDGRPKPPRHLTERGREFFEEFCDDLEAQGRLSPAFAAIIGVAASRADQQERASLVLQEKGWHYECTKKDGEVMLRPHPAVSQLYEAQRHFHSLVAELGLTPASLHKVGGMGAGKKKNAFEALG